MTKISIEETESLSLRKRRKKATEVKKEEDFALGSETLNYERASGVSP